MKIKMIADTTDSETKDNLKRLWIRFSYGQRLIVLNEMGHSEKWAHLDFDDLTGEIQSKLVMKTFSFETWQTALKEIVI